MSNSLPDLEVPVTLRPATELGARVADTQAAAGRAAAPAAPAAGPELQLPTPGDAKLQQHHSSNGSGLTDVVLAMTGVALLASAGWLVERRRRLARRAAAAADIVAAHAAPANAASFDPLHDPAETAGGWPVAVPSAADRRVALPTAALQPQEVATAAAPPSQDWQQYRAPMLGVAAQNRLITSLMWLRSVTAGAAILAAIAIVVFWSIETADRRAGETGLIMPLLLLLLAGWAASWGAGRLANRLHRWFFGRVHPKFDN